MIDGGVAGDDHDAVDAADADALYRLLEEEVVPAFYDRDARGVPRRWIATVKEAIRTVAPRFSRAPDGQGIRGADVRRRRCWSGGGQLSSSLPLMAGGG